MIVYSTAWSSCSCTGCVRVKYVRGIRRDVEGAARLKKRSGRIPDRRNRLACTAACRGAGWCCLYPDLVLFHLWKLSRYMLFEECHLSPLIGLIRLHRNCVCEIQLLTSSYDTLELITKLIMKPPLFFLNKMKKNHIEHQNAQQFL